MGYLQMDNFLTPIIYNNSKQHVTWNNNYNQIPHIHTQILNIYSNYYLLDLGFIQVYCHLHTLVSWIVLSIYHNYYIVLLVFKIIMCSYKDYTHIILLITAVMLIIFYSECFVFNLTYLFDSLFSDLFSLSRLFFY